MKLAEMYILGFKLERRFQRIKLGRCSLQVRVKSGPFRELVMKSDTKEILSCGLCGAAHDGSGGYENCTLATYPYNLSKSKSRHISKSPHSE